MNFIVTTLPGFQFTFGYGALCDVTTTSSFMLYTFQGVCELDGLFGFCYLNYKTGDYNCDDDAKCASKSDTFRGAKQKGGCFGNGVCCCKSEEVQSRPQLTSQISRLPDCVHLTRESAKREIPRDSSKMKGSHRLML